MNKIKYLENYDLEFFLENKGSRHLGFVLCELMKQKWNKYCVLYSACKNGNLVKIFSRKCIINFFKEKHVFLILFSSALLQQ